jgi:hypothetical protein
MLVKLYRWGPSRCVIRKSYVFVRPRECRFTPSQLRSETPLRILPHHATESVIRIECAEPIWLHNPVARKKFFQSLARAVSELGEEARRAGGFLVPCGVQLRNLRWDQVLDSDLHIIETFNVEEQTIYTNLLRLFSDCLIAVGGRAGIRPDGSANANSRLRIESIGRFSPRFWVSTEPRFVSLAEAQMRAEQGIPNLDALEVVPRFDGLPLGVVSSLIDAQAFPTSVRAFSILHQAIYLRARRMAGTGVTAPSARQEILERNRSRAVSDGLQARFEPGAKPAREVFLDLVESLREEFQVLEADVDELAPIIIGVHLRSLGFGAFQSENEVLQDALHNCAGSHWRPEELLSELLTRAGLRDLQLERNQQAYKAIVSELLDWWKSWLKSSTPATRHDSAARKPLRDEQPQGRERECHSLLKHHKRPGDVLLELFNRASRHGGNAERAALLRTFQKRTSTVELGLAMSQIAPEDRLAVASWIAPNAAQVKAIIPDSQFWANPRAAELLVRCREKRIAILAVEVAQKDEPQLREWLAELRKQMPQGFEMFPWARPRHGGKLRQEIILVGMNEDL